MNTLVTPATQTDPQLRAFTILTEIARARGQVYRWLALGFYAPDETFIRALNSGQAIDEIEMATVWLGQDQKRLTSHLVALRQHATMEPAALSKEFSRLFCKSAERISLRESTYRWREASTPFASADDVARSLRQQYGQFGVAPAQDQADHLAVELEFMAFLCERENKEWNTGAAETARQLRRQARAFLDDHLARWFPEFCWRITEQAQDSFYAALARLTNAWLKLEYGPGYGTIR